jgi:hypothetical protein
VGIRVGKRSLSWYGYVIKRDKKDVNRRVMNLNVKGWRGKGQPEKRWIDCVRQK